MTIAEALSLRKGDYVCHPAAVAIRADYTPVRRPVRVTEVWTNEGRTIVMLRLASIAKDAWLHATEYELPPAGLAWDRETFAWVSREELARRKAERAA